MSRRRNATTRNSPTAALRALVNTDSAVNIGAFNGGSELTGDIAEVLIYNRIVSAADTNLINGYFNDHYGMSLPSFTKMVVEQGDSLTVSGFDGTPGDGWSGLACAGNIGPAYCVNTAIGGDVLTNASSERASYIDPLLSAGLKNILVIWLGTNDLAGGTSAATLYSTWQSACAAAHTAGWKVVAATVVDRANINETVRATYNTDLRNDTCWDALADVGGNAQIGCNGCTANATYFNSDQTHLTDAGQAVAAGIFETAINLL